MSSTPTIAPESLSDEEFLRTIPLLLGRYVSLRARNVPARQAMTRVLGANQDDGRINDRIRRLESTETYCAALERAIHGPEGAKPGWTAAQAIWDLRELINDSSTSASARAGAIGQLNLLTKIVVIDENGKTRASDRPELLDMLAKLYPGLDLQTAKESLEMDLLLVAKSRQ